MMYLSLFQGGAANGRAGSDADAPAIAMDLGSLYEILVQGGWLMVPIALCSILVLAYTVERSIGLRRGRIVPRKLARGLGEAVDAGRVDEALRLCEESRSPLATIARSGLRMHGKVSRPEIEKAMEDAGLREVTRLKRNVRPLATIASIAPLLGLLGTVLGMIEAFNVVAGGGIGKEELLARGIAMALVTTGAGLSVAIPALALYHYFSGRVQSLVLAIDELLSGVVASLAGPEPAMAMPAPATDPSDTAASNDRAGSTESREVEDGVAVGGGR